MVNLPISRVDVASSNARLVPLLSNPCYQGFDSLYLWANIDA